MRLSRIPTQQIDMVTCDTTPSHLSDDTAVRQVVQETAHCMTCMTVVYRDLEVGVGLTRLGGGGRSLKQL